MEKHSALLAANYSNDTGYAWNNIYRLFNVIARALYKKNIGICLSFSKIIHPIKILDEEIIFNAFTFDPFRISVRSLINLKKRIKQHNIRYVYFTDQKPCHWLYLLLRLWGVEKIIIHSRVSVPNPYPPASEKGIRRLIKKLLNNLHFLTADYVYAVSDFVRDRIIRKGCFPSEKVKKILNGIDLEKFNCNGNQTRNNVTTIFTCSRATKHKGISVLIDAAKIIKDHFLINDFVVEYAGDGPDLSIFKKKVKDLGLSDNFLFLGQLSNTREKTCEADIVVIPSIWGDACPSAVMEGMAAGKAVLTTTAGGIPEIVGNGNSSCLVPPGDSERMAKELVELISNVDKRRKLAKNARKRAEQELSENLYHQNVINCLLEDYCIQ